VGTSRLFVCHFQVALYISEQVFRVENPLGGASFPPAQLALTIAPQTVTVLLLLHDERLRALAPPCVCSHVASLLAPRLRPLETNLAEHFSNPLRWHVSGYRYLFHDRPNRTVRCSPSTKVSPPPPNTVVRVTRVRRVSMCRRPGQWAAGREHCGTKVSLVGIGR
jgi:hypothetical protein